MENKGILIAVVVVAIVVWFLFNKASSTVANANKSIKQTYTTGTTVNALATNLAPALGTFLSKAASSYGSGAATPASSSQMSYISDNPADYTNDQLDTYATAEDYAANPLQGTIFGD